MRIDFRSDKFVRISACLSLSFHGTRLPGKEAQDRAPSDGRPRGEGVHVKEKWQPRKAESDVPAPNELPAELRHMATPAGPKWDRTAPLSPAARQVCGGKGVVLSQSTHLVRHIAKKFLTQKDLPLFCVIFLFHFISF